MLAMVAIRNIDSNVALMKNHVNNINVELPINIVVNI